MKIADAEREIWRIWAQWDSNSENSDKYGDHFGLDLYIWLENNRSDLLRFKCSGDKYQRINCWVMRWQRNNPHDLL